MARVCHEYLARYSVEGGKMLEECGGDGIGDQGQWHCDGDRQSEHSNQPVSKSRREKTGSTHAGCCYKHGGIYMNPIARLFSSTSWTPCRMCPKLGFVRYDYHKYRYCYAEKISKQCRIQRRTPGQRLTASATSMKINCGMTLEQCQAGLCHSFHGAHPGDNLQQDTNTNAENSHTLLPVPGVHPTGSGRMPRPWARWKNTEMAHAMTSMLPMRDFSDSGESFLVQEDAPCRKQTESDDITPTDQITCRNLKSPNACGPSRRVVITLETIPNTSDATSETYITAVWRALLLRKSASERQTNKVRPHIDATFKLRKFFAVSFLCVHSWLYCQFRYWICFYWLGCSEEWASSRAHWYFVS